jgi:PAS domain S-box-containing protein
VTILRGFLRQRFGLWIHDRHPLNLLSDLGNRADGGARSERTRRGVLLGLLLLNLLIVALCAWLLLASRRADIATAKSEALNDARQTAQVAIGLFDKAAVALSAVSLQVERQLDSAAPDLSTLWSMEDAQTAQVPQIQRIGVFDAQGAQLCGLPLDRCPGLNVSDRDYFKHLREHPQESVKLYGPYDSRLDGKPTLVLARALRLKDGKFAGVGIAVMPLERFRKVVTIAREGAEGTVSLRTLELNLLLRQPELPASGSAKTNTAASETLRAAVASAPGEGVARTVALGDGIDRVTAYHRVEGYPLYVIVGRGTNEFLAGWNRQVAWTGVFLLLFAAVSWQLVRVTSTSLRRHAQAMRLYDTAPCGYHTLDANGTYLSINATELAWLKRTRDNVIGKSKPTDFLTEEGRATFAAHFPELIRTGNLEGLELDLVASDGAIRRVVVNATAVRDASGAFLHSNSVMHDITALHEARKEVQSLAQQQGVMLDNDLVGIVRLVNRHIVWKNPAMDRIFGHAGDDWLGMPTRTLFPDDETHQRVGAESQVAWREKRTYRFQMEMVRKDGGKVWIDASGSELKPDTGEVLMLFVDITPLKAAEEARVRAAGLEAQNLQLRETNRLKSELLSNMSHELRTPLNAVLGFGQMLESGAVKPDSPKYGHYLRQIVASGKHLLHLIEEVLDYAKVEAGKMQFTPEPVSVPHTLNEVVGMLQADASAKGIAVHIEVDEQVESVLTDGMRLQQMVLALVGNAIKFSHEGGSVELRATPVDDKLWQLAVSDKGIGIEESNLPRLFSPFVQLSSGATKAFGGTGIGLALVRKVAEAQGGTVEVRSQVGQGSTFALILPRDLDSALG